MCQWEKPCFILKNVGGLIFGKLASKLRQVRENGVDRRDNRSETFVDAAIRPDVLLRWQSGMMCGLGSPKQSLEPHKLLAEERCY